MIGVEFAMRFAWEWVEAWNAHDLDRVLSQYDDDFEMASPRIVDLGSEPSGILVGKAAVRAYWQEALSRMPDLRFDLLGIFGGVRSVAIHYRNQAGRFGVETFEFGPGALVVRSAAHYA